MKHILVLITAMATMTVGAFAAGKATADDDATSAVASPITTSTLHDMANMSGDDHHDMAGMEIDDRGFSLLQNGEQHAGDFTQGMSPAERIELGRQLVLAREVALQYPTVKDAEAAGLRRAGPFSPGLGAHYISFGNAGGNAGGAMTDDDIRRPLAWMYDGTHPDSRVVGLFYTSPVADAEGFAGPNDTWHSHTNICLVTGADGAVDTPLGADRGATQEECDAVGGALLEQTQYLLHVWVVPGFESPEGVFAHLSSAITCDDGTYETIADVTKIGTSTTQCKDGTE